MVGGQAGFGLRTRRRWAALAAGAALAVSPACRAEGSTAHKLQPPAPIPVSVRIPLDPLGFEPQNRSWLSYRVPAATLDFIDDTHLLFTCHQLTLMRREAKEPEDDEDQTIAAFVIELPSGKVVERASWRMHDKGRYLWSLGHGRFLERERNTLYLLNKSLQARAPYIETDGPLRALEISPDDAQLIVEYQMPESTAAEGDDAARPAPTLGPDAPPVHHAHRVRMLIVNTATDKVEKQANLSSPVALNLADGGYLELEQGKGHTWNAMLTPFTGESRVVAQLTSLCQPEIHMLSERVFMAQVCIPYTSDRLVQAYNLNGKKLWEQQWESRYVWGNFAYAENGSRFAYESIQLDHALAALDPIDETSMTGQPVGVYDVADGTLRMVAGADPILSAGQNYALSSDGERFAVLRDGAIEVYRLPPASIQ